MLLLLPYGAGAQRRCGRDLSAPGLSETVPATKPEEWKLRMTDSYIGEPLLTVSEVARMMRVSNMTVYRLIKSSQLPALRVGKNYRIRASDVEKYLEDREVGGGTSV